MRMWHNAARLLNHTITNSNTPQKIRFEALSGKNADGENALSIAFKCNAPIELVKAIVEANYVALSELDKTTGFYPFMLAAVGSDSNLGTVFELLRYLPGLIHDFL